MHFMMGRSGGGNASQYGNEKEDERGGEGGENQLHADPKRLFCSEGELILKDISSRRVFIPFDVMQ